MGVTMDKTIIQEAVFKKKNFKCFFSDQFIIYIYNNMPMTQVNFIQKYCFTTRK